MGTVSNGIWPPPAARYVMRTMSFGLSTGAAATAFTGYCGLAGILAAIAAALLLTEIIGGK
jgi:hypothetical protein